MDRKPTLVRNFVVKISNFIILFSFRRQYIVTIFYPPIIENKILNSLFLEGIPCICIPCISSAEIFRLFLANTIVFLCFLSRKFEKKLRGGGKLLENEEVMRLLMLQLATCNNQGCIEKLQINVSVCV